MSQAFDKDGRPLPRYDSSNPEPIRTAAAPTRGEPRKATVVSAVGTTDHFPTPEEIEAVRKRNLEAASPEPGEPQPFKWPQSVVDFDQFLNEPPEYEELRMVRDYRHMAYPKWDKAMADMKAMVVASPVPPAPSRDQVLPCGHPSALLVKSVESSYEACEFCVCMERCKDAEQREQELMAERDALKESLRALKSNPKGETPKERGTLCASCYTYSECTSSGECNHHGYKLKLATNPKGEGTKP
jgi:hypothetical protein